MRVERPGGGILTVRRSEHGPWWVVSVDAHQLRLTADRTWPYASSVGDINDRGTLRVARPAASLPRNWSQVARRALEDARSALYASGQLRNLPEERRRRREEREGSFLVRLNTGETSRFDEMPRAMSWAEQQMATGTSFLADFHRIRSDGTETEDPISMLYRNEYGHIRVGPPRTGRLAEAYAALREAARLTGLGTEKGTPPHERSYAWQIAADALEEAGLPVQADRAERYAEFWARRSRVSSRGQGLHLGRTRAVPKKQARDRDGRRSSSHRIGRSHGR